MRRRLLLASLALTAASRPAPSCESTIAAAERRAGTAPGLLHAIALVESGRRDPRTGQRHPWPWTVTAGGIGTYYPAKPDAIAAVQALQAAGTSSIDVGCLQVNLQWHPDAFRSLDEAFDPAANATYAGRFLKSLYARTGDWAQAAAFYHSQTPALAADYGKLVLAVWSGAPVPTLATPSGDEIVELPGGSVMRLFRTASAGRIVGVLN